MLIDVAEAYEHVPLNREHNYSNLPTLIDAPHGQGHMYVTTAEVGAPKSSRFNGLDNEPPVRQHNEVPLGIQGRQHRNIEGFFESALEVMVGVAHWAAELLVVTVDAIASMMQGAHAGQGEPADEADNTVLSVSTV